MILQGKDAVPVKEVILHCAAFKNPTPFRHMRAFQMFATVNRWHRERGFSGFAYHGLIMPDGTWYPGRPFTMQGAHALGHNRGTLGILLIESKEITHIREFDDWFTFPQRDELRRRLSVIPGLEKVTGHNDYSEKLCPGFKVETQDWLL